MPAAVAHEGSSPSSGIKYVCEAFLSYQPPGARGTHTNDPCKPIHEGTKDLGSNYSQDPCRSWLISIAKVTTRQDCHMKGLPFPAWHVRSAESDNPLHR